MNKKILVGEPVLQNTLVFLIEAYLKPVLNNSNKIGYCKVKFYNVCIKLYGICVEVKMTLK